MEAIEKFLSISSSYGYGYGSGSGYGYGYGDGSGSGYGYGSGSGSGSGYGYGSGDGDGSGYGYGSGDGLKTFNKSKVFKIDDTPTIIYSVKNNIAKGAILNDDLTLRDCYIAKSGNYFAHGETIKKSLEDAISKELENKPIAERISDFAKTFNNKDSYSNQEFSNWHKRLTGSCDLGRTSFMQNKGIDINGKMTVKEFISITKDAYGSDVINELDKQY